MAALLLIASLLVFLYMCIFFVIAQIKQNTTVVDLAWSTGFLLIALFSFFKTHLFLARHCIVTALVIVWSLRLTMHLGSRIYHTQEDPRYAQFRKKWGKFFALRSFFQIFMAQGLLLCIATYQIVVINTCQKAGSTLLDILGLILWIIGFLCEVIGDYQLQEFLKNPKHRGKVINQGLWYYTRHPNYFGEVVMWWGIFLFALPCPFGWSAMISPITITILILFISGIPMTEKQFEGNAAYQEYKRRTSAFFPWFKRTKTN